MKAYKLLVLMLVPMLLLSACKGKQAAQTQAPAATEPNHQAPAIDDIEAVQILLSDETVTVDGVAAGSEGAVYVANDIIYYESGKDFTYGEGTEQDAHSPEEAAAHRVVHISQPGAYRLSGQLTKGQVAVDLGKDAKEDPNAVVTLILSDVDITCQVAPAIIFYNVYECGSDDAEKATKDVDTSAAGANVIIADGTTNTLNGSYVARIYKPDSVVLNQDQTAVSDAKKLHKYDGTLYSKMSMNVTGNTGTLNINAENEGLDTELHLTINGGNINIRSGNDGINTNEDNVSVTTVNGGKLTIAVTGETGEGDGIDSNGWLVIRGGTVVAAACATSADAGIDSDLGIHITGGTVIATGHMLDQIENGGQTYGVLNFAQEQAGGKTVVLQTAEGKPVLETTPENSYSILIFSSSQLEPGTCSLWCDGKQMAGQSGGAMGGPGGMMRPEGQQPPQGQQPPELPNGQQPENFTPPQGGQMPENFTPPQGGQMPENFTPSQGGQVPENFTPPQGGQMPEGQQPPQGQRPQQMPGGANGEATKDFLFVQGGNMFSNIAIAENG